MKSTPYDSRAGGIAGDMSAWLRSVQEDNEEQLSRLRRNLRRAREQELTPRQQQMPELSCCDQKEDAEKRPLFSWEKTGDKGKSLLTNTVM